MVRVQICRFAARTLRGSTSPPVEPPGGYNPLGPIGFPATPGYNYTGHGAFVSIHYTDEFQGGALVELAPNDPSAETVSGQVTGPRYLWFNRLPGFPGGCWTEATGWQPDWLVSGTQTVTVETVPVPVSIEVLCTGSVLRGATVSCEARPLPSTATLAVTGWTFISTANDTVIRTTDVSAQTWTGQLVTDGRIDVTGTVAGHSARGTANVMVTSRDWSARTARSNHSTPGADGLPIHPQGDSMLGQSDLDIRLRADVGNYAAVITDGGPNDRFTYMTDIPYETFTVARVNYPAMTQGSDWYLLQYPRDRKIGGTTYCGQSRVLTLSPLVEAHEGTDPANQPDSHVGIYINDVTRDARVLAEALAGSNPNPEPTRVQIHNTASADSKAMDNDSRNNMSLPCVFKYFPP